VGSCGWTTSKQSESFNKQNDSNGSLIRGISGGLKPLTKSRDVHTEAPDMMGVAAWIIQSVLGMQEVLGKSSKAREHCGSSTRGEECPD